jgi:hypothetical protein
MAAAIRVADAGQVARPPGGRPRALWRAIGVGAGVLGGQGVAGYLHPVLGEALAAADVIVPLVITVILLFAILRGSSQTCERVFRLLRWIADRPEPPTPQDSKQPRRAPSS